MEDTDDVVTVVALNKRRSHGVWRCIRQERAHVSRRKVLQGRRGERQAADSVGTVCSMAPKMWKALLYGYHIEKS